MADEAVAEQEVKTDWRKDLQGISHKEFEERFEKGDFQELQRNDPEFRKAWETGSLFAKKPAEGLPAETPVSDPKISPIAEGVSSDKWWNKLGFSYGSEEEAVEKLKNLSDISSEYKAKLDRYNAERGKEGQRLKELQERLAQDEAEKIALKQKLNELSSKQASDSLSLPKRPDPLKFEDDEDTISDTSKAKFNVYYGEMNKFYDSMVNNFSNIAKENTELKNKVNDFASYIENDKKEKSSRAENEAREAYNKHLKKMFSEIDDLQKAYPVLKTKRSFKEIDDDIIKLGEGAEKILPKDEYESHKRIMETIHIYKPVDIIDGRKPQVRIDLPSKFNSLDEAYLIYLKRTGQLSKIENQKLINAERNGQHSIIDSQQKVQQGATVVPASQVGGENATTMKTDLEKANRLQELSDKPDMQLTASERKEYESLYSWFKETVGVGKGRFR